LYCVCDFGPKRDEVTGGWRKLHNEELHGLYCSPNIVRVIKVRRIRWSGHVRMGEVRGAYNILVGRPADKVKLNGSEPENKHFKNLYSYAISVLVIRELPKKFVLPSYSSLKS
jgi:hypothetical protein